MENRETTLSYNFFDCCIVVVLNAHNLTGNCDGAKMYFRKGAARTAVEASNLAGGLDPLLLGCHIDYSNRQ